MEQKIRRDRSMGGQLEASPGEASFIIGKAILGAAKAGIRHRQVHLCQIRGRAAQHTGKRFD